MIQQLGGGGSMKRVCVLPFCLVIQFPKRCVGEAQDDKHYTEWVLLTVRLRCAIDIASGYGLKDREVGVGIPVRSSIFTPYRLDRLWGLPNLQWVPGDKATHTPTTSVEVNKMWIYSYTPPYFVALCLVNHRESILFTYDFNIIGFEKIVQRLSRGSYSNRALWMCSHCERMSCCVVYPSVKRRLLKSNVAAEPDGNALDLYMRVITFKSWLGYQLTWLGRFVDCSQLFHRSAGIVSRVGYRRILPNLMM
jgi:hypothetical protein